MGAEPGDGRLWLRLRLWLQLWLRLWCYHGGGSSLGREGAGIWLSLYLVPAGAHGPSFQRPATLWAKDRLRCSHAIPSIDVTIQGEPDTTIAREFFMHSTFG